MEQEKIENVIPQSGSSPFSDPTYNVNQLVNSEVRHLHEVIALNKEILNLHIVYSEKLSLAESKRIDAIRAVDVGAVALDKERNVQQASVLSTQVSQSAETLRNLVGVTAAATATQFQQVINPIIERISLLEKAQYEGIGKGRVTDPMMSELLAEVKSLSATRSVSTGKSLGIGQMVALIMGAATLIGIIGGLVLKFMG